MNTQIMAGAAAIIIALNMGVANAAFIGTGSNPGFEEHQQRLQDEPGYSIGTGAAHVGDGSSQGYLARQHQLLNEPGYSLGTGTANLGG
jgi:hypothetical protein